FSLRLLIRNGFRLTDPAFHTDFSVHGIRFGKAVIDRSTQSMERNLSFAIPLSARNLRAAKTARTTNFNTQCSKIHGRLNRLLHRSTERNSALNLQRHIFGDQLRIQLRCLNFLDINLDLFSARHPSDLFGHLLNLSALTTNHDSGPSRKNGNADAIPGPFDYNLRYRSHRELLLYKPADLQIGMQEFRKFFRRSIPA